MSKLPPLPKPVDTVELYRRVADVYTAEQMQAYAHEARALAAPTAPAPTEPSFVEWLKTREADSYSCSLLVRDALARLATPLSAAQPEAVAWAIIASNTGRMCQVTLEKDEIEGHNPAHIVPLFAAPTRAAVNPEAVGGGVLIARDLVEQVIDVLMEAGFEDAGLGLQRAMLAAAPTTEATSSSDAERLEFERDPFEKAIDSFLEDYEMIGETEAGHDACYTPNENDKALIKDAIMGLLADPEWDRLWGQHIDAAIATKGGKL